MDIQTLEVLSRKVARAKFIKERLEYLNYFRTQLENAKNGALLIRFAPGDGSSLELSSLTSGYQVFEQYKDILLEGVKTEIKKLENEFKEL